LENLTSICQSCHNRKTRIVEQMGKKLRANFGWIESGFPGALA